MNLFKTLKQFKTIQPDHSFTEQSKRAILASPQNIPAMNPFRGMLQLLETGAAVVLAGFFILLITGALSNQNSNSPVQYSVIDPAGLHAEAQAIDIQIKLANVSYPEVVASQSGAFASQATSSALSTSMKTASSSAPSTGAPVATGGSSSANAAASSTTVDQALQALSE
jgi:hypothetical protein